MKKICLIVPVYNESLAIPIFYNAIVEIKDKISHDIQTEIIFVDDGSKDSTLNVIKKIARSDVSVHYLSFSRNFGKEAALFCGLEHADADWCVTMDVDLQHPPELIPEMLSFAQQGYDHVATRRSSRTGESFLRSIFSQCFYFLINCFTDIKIENSACDYRMMSRKMVQAILSMQEKCRFSKGIFEWVGFEAKWISFDNVTRSAGETKWSGWKLIKYAMEGLFAFSVTPLVLVLWTGIICMFASIGYAAFIAIRTLFYSDPVRGYPSLVCFVLFFSGLQMFCLGIVGQYIAKIYLETKKRPVYICKEDNFYKTIN